MEELVSCLLDLKSEHDSVRAEVEERNRFFQEKNWNYEGRDSFGGVYFVPAVAEIHSAIDTQWLLSTPLLTRDGIELLLKDMFTYVIGRFDLESL